MRRNRSRRIGAAGALRTLPCAIALVVLAFCTRGLEAQGSTAQECCITLLFPFGARAVSIGQALTARTSIDGVFFNPAALANIGKTFEPIVHYASTLQGDGRNFALTVPKDVGGAGTFALTYVLVDQGNFEVTDDNGTVTGEAPLREQHVHITFATTITRGLRGGVTYTFYHRSILESAATQLLNAGLQYRVPRVRGLELGASLMHAGLALQVRNAEQKDPTPARVRFGAAYGRLLTRDSAVSLWLSGDMVSRLVSFGAGTATDSVRGQASGWAPAFDVGAELELYQMMFVRAGYAMSGDGLAVGGGGIGFGIRLERFTIGVGKSFGTTPLGQEGAPWQISVGYTF